MAAIGNSGTEVDVNGFQNRTAEEFKKDALKLGNIITGSRLGWDGNNRPEVYGPNTINVSRWFFSWDPKRGVKAHGYTSGLLAIQWATAYMKTVGTTNSVIGGKFLVLGAEYAALANRATKHSQKEADSKTSVAKLFKTAGKIMNGEEE